MKLKTKVSLISIFLILTVGYLPTPANALNTYLPPSQLSNLADITDSDENRGSGALRELIIDNHTSLYIVQQPNKNSDFVTPLPNYVTAFQTALDYGTIGLLAHNYLAGRNFFQILPGQEITLIYRDNRTEKFVVTQIQHYQALTPDSPSSNFIDLDTGKHTTAPKLFEKIYISKTKRLVLQTCIEADQNPTWGRLFIIAEPIEKIDNGERLQ